VPVKTIVVMFENEIIYQAVLLVVIVTSSSIKVFKSNQILTLSKKDDNYQYEY